MKRREGKHSGIARPTAFTLVELLVVISIIAVLAAMVVGVSAYAMRKMRISRIEAGLQELQTAIENYKVAIGSYPPDHANTASGDAGAHARPPLYHELTGSVIVNDPVRFRSREGVLIPQNEILAAFGHRGFANASTDPAQVRSFLPSLDPAKHEKITANLHVLVVPVRGPSMIPSAAGPSINTWRYNSTNPVNNPGSYDLWAEVTIGGETVVIGNWKGTE